MRRHWMRVVALSVACMLGQPGFTAEAPQAAAPKPANLKDAMGGVVDLAAEVRLIEKRLTSLEQSVKGIDQSLAPVGALTRPDGMRLLLQEAGDLAYDRGRALILFAMACVGVLMVLAALLWRWVAPARRS
jgi:hypothetical protein